MQENAPFDHVPNGHQQLRRNWFGPAFLGAIAGILLWQCASAVLRNAARSHVMPDVTFISAERMQAQACSDHAACFRTRAFYEPATRRIYLADDWSPNDFDDLAVLLHETVHHLQAIGSIPYACSASAELPAYALQEAFYRAHDRDPGGRVPSRFTRFARYSCILEE